MEKKKKELKQSDRLLPIANVSKIMKNQLPVYGKIARESKISMQYAASEFIAIVTCVAKDIINTENRCTMTGEDLIRALNVLGMPYYAQACKIWYKKLQEDVKLENDKRAEGKTNKKSFYEKK